MATPLDLKTSPSFITNCTKSGFSRRLEHQNSQKTAPRSDFCGIVRLLFPENYLSGILEVAMRRAIGLLVMMGFIAGCAPSANVAQEKEALLRLEREW